MILTTPSGTALTIPLNLESTRDAKDWSDIYRRPYIFSGPVSGIRRTESCASPQVPILGC